LNDFVNVAWSEDSFSKWWAQNKNSIALGLVSSAIGLGLGAASGMIAPATAEATTEIGLKTLTGAQNSIFSTIGQIKDAKNVPD